jgi:hypothetical protein
LPWCRSAPAAAVERTRGTKFMPSLTRTAWSSSGTTYQTTPSVHRIRACLAVDIDDSPIAFKSCRYTDCHQNPITHGTLTSVGPPGQTSDDGSRDRRRPPIGRNKWGPPLGNGHADVGSVVPGVTGNDDR